MTNVFMAATFVEQTAKYEEAVARFYSFCAMYIPDDKEFWNTLASQEMWHAKFLRELKEELKLKKVKLLPGKFNISEIEKAMAYVQQMTRIVRANGVNLDKALEIASIIENNTVENNAFKAFDETAPAVRASMKFLHEQEKVHLDILSRRIQDQKNKNSPIWVKCLRAIKGFGKTEKKS